MSRGRNDTFIIIGQSIYIIILSDVFNKKGPGSKDLNPPFKQDINFF